MSLVGNFTTNFDKSIETIGPGSPISRHRPGSPTSHHRLSFSNFLSGHPDGEDAVSKDAREAREDISAEKADKLIDSSVSSSDEDVEKEIQKLARTYSRKSWSEVGSNPFEAEEGSPVNPTSKYFSARAWTMSMLKLLDAEGRHKGRSAGFAFKNLSAYGYSEATDYQKTVGNIGLSVVGIARKLMGQKGRRVDILRNFDGLVHAGEMLVVLGPPGSGCSTFLKTIAGETHGYYVTPESYINYQGISFGQMHNDFRGEAIYTAEQDVHFPQLTVGDTLTFAARARAPRHIPGGVSREVYADHLRDVMMATFGIRHTTNTKVGNDFVRGVSGGERKRVTIAEAALSGAPLQCWDNSTRGLDSANAVEFCKTLKVSTELSNSTAAVAIYQAPQSAYDIFDKVLVLYDGYQIYFGRTTDAKTYFLKIGFECPERQTDADFLTSMTSATERIVRRGFEGRVPRTPEEFAARWKASPQRQALVREIEQYDRDHPIGGQDMEKFRESRRAQQARGQRLSSPYTLAYGGQVKLCLWRGFKRLVADPSLTLSQLFGNVAMALIIGSIFYNLPDDTGSFYSRGALLFFAILINAFGSALEILTLYAQRPIVEKHTRYALYHPSAEAFASMLTDVPYKVMNCIAFNLILYFLTNLRREPGAFFFFLLMTFTLTLVMSMLFRTVASVSRTLTQALAPAAVLILAIVIYTGFAITIPYMRGWARWINWLDPVAFGFEALMVNEFSGREFRCALSIPTGPPLYQYGTVGPYQICNVVGSVAGRNTVNGDAYIASFEYYAENKWRNYGILYAFMFGLMFMYLAAAEFISAKKSKGEVLLFRRGYQPASLTQKGKSDDLEMARTNTRLQLQKSRAEQDVAAVIQKQTAIFQWRDVCYDIKIKGEPRRILDHVDGWVKPGTMTALMGVSGAGKTTLLDCLASRVSFGIISGEMLVDGRQRDGSFQRKTGYVQQQDLHLATSTVREALNFSAILRQPAHIPRAEKLAYVDEVIKLLEMEEYADAVVGVPGEGLNVEQRKRLTIAVEMAAKPQLLLFLDEPTSGLDSQTSWSILDLLEKLTNNGQAILCTIHQPSAVLFQRFDRLLFLAAGGKTVYFGPIGENSQILSRYFESNGAPKLPEGDNPAEWMLEVIGAAPGSHTDIDWFQTWRDSEEYREVHRELDEMKEERPKQAAPASDPNNKEDYREFAAPFTVQLWETLKRVFEQYWRTPSYVWSKLLLVSAVGLFIGFSFFKEPNTQQGLQNQMFGIFLLTTIFGQLVQQIMPLFVTQRSLYEVRERPSKTYSWKAFMISNIFVEIPWSTLCAILVFFTWYYPIGLYQNATYHDQVHVRGFLEFLFIWEFLLFSSTFAFFAVAGIETAETAGNLANLCFSLVLVFCGVLVGPNALPGFWIFMYRISPFTYMVNGILSTAVAGAPVVCAAEELLNFPAPPGQTCLQYLAPYLNATGATLTDPNARNCQLCPIQSTDQFLEILGADYSKAWRNFGVIWIYIVFNIVGAVFIYWVARVPKGAKKDKEEKSKTTEAPASIEDTKTKMDE